MAHPGFYTERIAKDDGTNQEGAGGTPPFLIFIFSRDLLVVGYPTYGT